MKRHIISMEKLYRKNEYEILISVDVSVIFEKYRYYVRTELYLSTERVPSLENTYMT
jgi:hypothetical protein